MRGKIADKNYLYLHQDWWSFNVYYRTIYIKLLLVFFMMSPCQTDIPSKWENWHVPPTYNSYIFLLEENEMKLLRLLWGVSHKNGCGKRKWNCKIYQTLNTDLVLWMNNLRLTRNRLWRHWPLLLLLLKDGLTYSSKHLSQYSLSW